LEENIDKVNWWGLSSNPKAIHILEQNLDKVCWNDVVTNPNAIHLVARLNTSKMRENCKAFAKELKQYVFDTERLARIYKLYVLNNTTENDCTSCNEKFDTYNQHNQLFSNTYSSLETSAKYLQQLKQTQKKEIEFYQQLSKLEEEITRFAIELRIHQSVFNSKNVTVRAKIA